LGAKTGHSSPERKARGVAKGRRGLQYCWGFMHSDTPGRLGKAGDNEKIWERGSWEYNPVQNYHIGVWWGPKEKKGEKWDWRNGKGIGSTD